MHNGVVSRLLQLPHIIVLLMLMTLQIIDGVVRLSGVPRMINLLFGMHRMFSMLVGRRLVDCLLNWSRAPSSFRYGALDNRVCLSFRSDEGISAFVSYCVGLSVGSFEVFAHHFVELIAGAVFKICLWNFLFFCCKGSMGLLGVKLCLLISIEFNNV